MSDPPTLEKMLSLKVALEREVARLREELKRTEDQLERLSVTCEVLNGWPDSMPSFGKFGFQRRVPVRDMLLDVMKSLPNHGLRLEDIRTTAEERFNRSISRRAASSAFSKMRNEGVLELSRQGWHLMDSRQAE